MKTTGFASPAADYLDRSLDFNELLVANAPATFCFRVDGPEMEEAGLLPGDVLVVDRSLNPRAGDIVVAAVEGAFLARRFGLHRGHPVLLDGQGRELCLTEGDRLVWGVAAHLIRHLRAQTARSARRSPGSPRSAAPTRG